ncbi:MAG: hypothetical protein HYZ53_02795 [Planctomycetes bacterium]|nr:hypothetical protein [Planctomycetota bacterium]
MPYEPRPIPTSRIDVPPDLRELTERLARNVHDLWALGRMKEGWRFGRRHDRTRRRRPDLVPYEELPESERAYDRTTAMETLKAILALGYRLELPGRSAARADASAPRVRSADEEVTARLEGLLRAPDRKPNLPAVLGLWKEIAAAGGEVSRDLYVRLGAFLLKAGDPLMAYDVLDRGAHERGNDRELLRLQGLSLARLRMPRRAGEILQRLHTHGDLEDVETLGILAGTEKTLAEQAETPAAREEHLRAARKIYEEAYRIALARHDDGGAFWTGINAATVRLLLGERHGSHALARQVRDLCVRELARVGERAQDAYWPLATLGEVALLLGQLPEARQWYAKAVASAPGNLGEFASARRNARLILTHLGEEPGRVLRCFPLPKVVVFAGHMIDQPHRKRPRFPPELEGPARAALKSRLKAHDAGIGFASGACGSDLLFLEAMLERKAEVHVVLPYAAEQFRKDSVDLVATARWGARFDKVLKDAARTFVASRQQLPLGTVTYDFVNLLLHGLAAIRAAQLDAPLVPLAFWNGGAGDGPGGTADVVHRWRDAGCSVDVIDSSALLRRRLPALARRAASGAVAPHVRTRAPHPAVDTEIKAILFADVKGFSKLPEEKIPAFVRDVLGMVSRMVLDTAHAPLVENTWGDGLYMVFEGVLDAGLFALELCDRFASMRWQDVGLPENLSIRIGLHAGPVYCMSDPVTRRRTYMGTHVSRAARIEPITPPGSVYASEEFAALAAAARVREFSCEYVGQNSWAKDYGTFRTFMVCRRAPPMAPEPGERGRPAS